MMIADPTALDFALAYAARGWAVLALWWGEDGICACPRGAECESPGKHPIAFIGKRAMCPNGVKDATLDPERIRQWWARVPDANVGIATGAAFGLVALDSDPRNGGDESLRTLEDNLPDGLPETPRSITGSGGEHVLFAAPAGRVANFKGRDWGFPGLDVKGDGGYIVAPPSLHVSGRRYQWDAGAHPDDLALAPLPPALLRRLSVGTVSTAISSAGSGPLVLTAGGTDIGAVLAGVPEGERGVSLFRLAAKLRRVDVPYAVARELVFKAAAAASPPYQPAAALKHLDSAYSRYEPSEVPEPEAGASDDAPDGAAPARFRLWSAAEMEAMPRQQWLIEGLIVEDCVVMLAAKERSFKTFLTLDIAASLAAGIPWHGHTTHGGHVVYVSAEGRAGLGKRIKAWRKARGVDRLDRLFVLPEPVRLMDGKDVDELLATLMSLPERPVLIVLDTLARCMVGGDENSQKDATVFFDACARLQRTTGAVVLLIHHVNRDKGDARGSSVFWGNVDAHLHLQRDGQTLTLTCKKQKDFDEFEPKYLVREVVQLDDGETSLALRATRFTVETLSDPEQKVLQALRELGGVAESDAQWREAAEGLEISSRNYYRTKKLLMDRGYVEARRRGFAIKGLDNE